MFAGIDTQWDDLEDNVTQMLVYLVILGDGDEDLKDFDSSKVTDEMIESKKNEVININDAVDKIIMNLLSGALNSDNNGNGNSDGDGNQNENQNGNDNGNENGNPSNGESAGDGETAEDTYEQIRTLLKNKINEVITDQYKGYMLTAMKVVGGLIVFFAAVWAYLILKLVVNSLTGRMKTKMRLAYVFGWMPGLNLVVIPTVMFRIFTTSNFITQKLFTDLSVIESIGNTLNLSFASGGVFGFYAGVGLIAVAIVRFILKGALAGGDKD